MIAYDPALLRNLLAERSFRRGRFQLSSGAWSRIYFNLKPTMLHPVGARHCALGLLDAIGDAPCDYVAGLEMGAVPLLGAVAALGERTPALFVRKATKAYGSGALVEGLATEETLDGKAVVMIDDVATTGAAMAKTAAALREAGATVALALVILDREESARDTLAAQGITLRALFTATELGVTDTDRAPLT